MTVPMRNGQATEVTLPGGDQRAGQYTAPNDNTLARIRESEGFDFLPPDEEGIAAVEDRAHTAAWHKYLGLPDDS